MVNKQALLQQRARNINASKLLKETIRDFNKILKSKGGIKKIKYQINLIKQKRGSLNIEEKKALDHLIKRFIKLKIDQGLKWINSHSKLGFKTKWLMTFRIEELGKLRKYFTQKQEYSFQRGMNNFVRLMQPDLKKMEAGFKRTSPKEMLDEQKKQKIMMCFSLQTKPLIIISKYLNPKHYNLNVRPYFDRMLTHFTTLNKNEFNRIKQQRDFKSLHKLLYLAKTGLIFNEDICTSSVFAQFINLRKDIISFAETRVPLKFIKDHLAAMKAHTINIRDKVGKPFGRELDNTEGVTKKGGKYYINIDGKDWQITQVHLGDKHETIETVIFSLKGKETQIHCSVQYKDLYFKRGRNGSKNRLNINLLKKRMAEAFVNFAKQEKNKGALRKFDLPKDKPIGYISLFPAKPDYIIDNNQEYTIYFTRLLKSLGYQLDLSGMDGKTFAEPKKPKEFLKDKIAQLHNKGIKNFYLDFNAHGLSTGIKLGENIDSKFLLTLMKPYMDKGCRFTLTSLSCYGGGLRSGIIAFLKRNPQYGKSINLFLRAKPTALNYEAEIRRPGTARVYADYYSLYFSNFLMQGMTYGEASYRADIAAQQKSSTNAEAVVNGLLIAEQKAPKRNPNEAQV